MNLFAGITLDSETLAAVSSRFRNKKDVTSFDDYIQIVVRLHAMYGEWLTRYHREKKQGMSRFVPTKMVIRTSPVVALCFGY